MMKLSVVLSVDGPALKGNCTLDTFKLVIDSVEIPVIFPESSIDTPEDWTPLSVPSDRMIRLSAPKAVAAVTSPPPPADAPIVELTPPARIRIRELVVSYQKSPSNGLIGSPA